MTGETWTAASDTTEAWTGAAHYYFPVGYVDPGYVTENGDYSVIWAAPSDTDETWA